MSQLSSKIRVLAFLYIIVFASLATAAFVGALGAQVVVPNIGVFATAGINVCTTPACTQNLTSIAWGSVRAGQSYTKLGYVKNKGNLNLTLALSTSNFVPSGLAGILSVSWNYTTGHVVMPTEVESVRFTLTIPSGTTGYSIFSFDMLVAGTEV